MNRKIFINLPVADLETSHKFYTKMGFSMNPQFSDETAKCMVWSESIFLMIMNFEKFRTFSNKPIADAKQDILGLFSLSLENKEEVNLLLERGLQAGGKEINAGKDFGFMYLRTIEDPDGYTWELFYMDETKIPNA